MAIYQTEMSIYIRQCHYKFGDNIIGSNSALVERGEINTPYMNVLGARSAKRRYLFAGGFVDMYQTKMSIYFRRKCRYVSDSAIVRLAIIL